MFTMDSEAFRKDLARAIGALPQRTQEALKHTAQYAAVMARTSRLYKSHTFGLQKSIKGFVVGPGHAQTTATAPYAYWVENGNAPPGGGDIYPKRAKFLRFVLNGQLQFRKSVRPADPRPFMAEAATKSEPLFERLVKEAADGMFQ